MSCVGYHPTLRVYGKAVVQSRAIAAYSTDPNLEVKYSGQTIDMHCPYPDLLVEIQRLVEDKLGMRTETKESSPQPSGYHCEGFNHVMLNRYEDGSVYIGKHSDTKENKVRPKRNDLTSRLTSLPGHRQSESWGSPNVCDEPQEG